jgi:outer membrane lipoprotein carrier protein
VGAPTPEAAEVAKKVQARYETTRDLAARFSQELRIQAGGQVVRSSGEMVFQRPGKMRWTYESPEPQTIVADGKNLWIYQPADKQVLKAPLEDAFQSRTPVSFLLGVARLEADFQPKLLSPDPDGSLKLELLPRAEPGGALGVLTLVIDPSSFDVRAAIVKDPLGNTTEVRLLDVRRNEGVDASLFRFERPPGTDVIEAPKS